MRHDVTTDAFYYAILVFSLEYLLRSLDKPI